MRRLIGFFLILLLFGSCLPKNTVVLRNIEEITIDTDGDGTPLLKGRAVFFNPNGVRMKLREINVEVFLDGASSAHADQKLNMEIPANAEFKVSLEMHVSLQKQGLLDTVMSFLGGKKHEIHYKGFIRVKVHGVTVKVPVDYKDEISLKI